VLSEPNTRELTFEPFHLRVLLYHSCTTFFHEIW